MHRGKLKNIEFKTLKFLFVPQYAKPIITKYVKYAKYAIAKNMKNIHGASFNILPVLKILMKSINGAQLFECFCS